MTLELYNNSLCISGTALIRTERNPGGLLSKPMYDFLTRKDPSLVARRANGVLCSLVVIDRLPSKYASEIYRQYPDPRAQAKAMGYVERLEGDPQAYTFYSDYITADGKHLPPEVIDEYVNNARVLNMIRGLITDTISANRGRRTGLVSKHFEHVASSMQRIADGIDGSLSLPTSARRLEDTYKRYIHEGYATLVSRRWGNQNTVKITPEAGDWLIARYSTPVDRVNINQLWREYNALAPSRGWKPLKSDRSIDLFLHREDIQPKWMGMRNGEKKASEMYMRQHRTLLPTRRDTIWYGDGTKLNFYYRDADGRTCTCSVYEVIDVYSEVFLGYHISPTEDYQAQYGAFKMAMNTAQHKPYEIVVDNQGGHNKEQTKEFMARLARVCRRTAPYNGKSKTIESAFGRFQQEYLAREWFFTGQNIQAKKLESKANHEFILANAHNLPTLEEATAYYVRRREEWNAAPHPSTNIPRLQMYRQSVNTESPKVEIWDLINLFWMAHDRKVTYRASGLQLTIKGEKMAFEVLSSDGRPDDAFRIANIGAKFIVKYDLTDLSMVALYKEDASGERFVTMAQPYITIHRALQDQQDGEASFIRDMEVATKIERLDMVREAEDRLARHGLHPSQHGLNMPKPKGISAKLRDRLELGAYMKSESNYTPDLNEDEETVLDILKHY